MKTVLVIDVGEENIDDLRANITIYSKDYSKSLFTIINCPLKELPQKKIDDEDDDLYEVNYKWGFNDCLEEISGDDLNLIKSIITVYGE